ncbi:TetR/AcrR family transcriptional regulator [Microbacterium sp. DT81.1]|uniref:TetR/AcrR family transcriptional regulator n=1 Tax=Microbacterium sp. DT81.1 TaxID=3393413 RepID=UPI003CEF83DB
MSTKSIAEEVVTADPARRMSSEERRTQIIEAAIAVFGARGYVGSTTDEVARAASISQPYVVRLFGTKEKLFLAALEYCIDRLMDAFRAVQATADLQERKETMGQAYLRLLEVRGLHQLLSQAFLLGAHPVIGPAAREGFASVWHYLREAGFEPEEAQKFLATGMLINTMIGLRLTEEYGSDAGMTELFNECFPISVQMVLDAAPRIDEPW